ncbi:hypothetical protein BJP25_08240 [Actinokineospora bangkokensis]|uniref:Uncharacterized protein n=1 Tax=Actinokineospora bangkokensis TaxID=1193682 RepID=A0A1Q9LSG9_9PSEU|nr:hypothetical protein BJP25_08240 [Actinokineospora bangkokensis]
MSRQACLGSALRGLRGWVVWWRPGLEVLWPGWRRCGWALGWLLPQEWGLRRRCLPGPGLRQQARPGRGWFGWALPWWLAQGRGCLRERGLGVLWLGWRRCGWALE